MTTYQSLEEVGSDYISAAQDENSHILTSFEGKMWYNCSIENLPRAVEASRGMRPRYEGARSMVTIPRPAPIHNPDGTITIYLTRGYTTIVDAIDGDLAAYLWNSHVYPDGRTYAYHWKRKTAPNPPGQILHRIILERILGRRLETRELVDHKDNDSLNNRRENLRLANKSQNSCNQSLRRTSKTGYKWVSYEAFTGKYRTRAIVNGKSFGGKRYDTPEKAYEAICKEVAEHHGEFARYE